MGKFITDIKKVDDYTVVFQLSQSYSPFLANLAMDFASIFLEIPARDGNRRMLQWNSDRYIKPDADLSTLHMNVPINDRRKEGNASFKVEIPIRESLEAVGRRIALFARLADEHGLASI